MRQMLSFYKGKKVLVTGHTGFKGSWLCEILLMAGAEVTGYALEAPTTPSLFDICKLEERMHSIYGDIRDLKHLQQVFLEAQPEVVFHLAAQPLVRESYKNPVYTYETNVMGTVNVLECVRQTLSVKSFVNVTTDKVYQNNEWERGYQEDDILNGYDPYSNSKSCSELVTDSYKKSFFTDGRVAISTARAGNVIGGGDFAVDRIIPDCIRAAEQGKEIVVRNPYSVRPYQHVLEPLFVYLMIAKKQMEDVTFAGSYNVGPNEQDCINTGELVSLFCKTWSQNTGQTLTWENRSDGGPHEAGFLKLDCGKLKKVFAWEPKWNVETAIEKIVEWSVAYQKKESVTACMQNQILDFIGKEEKEKGIESTSVEHKNTPKVSVIMLTYNREKFLREMIECILAQSFTDFEYIIVDNGSADNSGKIADEYVLKDSRIKVIHRERGNIGSGRNAGLDVAVGKYIAFVDDDDNCTSDFLQFLYDLAEECQADVSICGATWSVHDEKRIMTAEESLELLLWRKHYNVAFPTKMIRKELFEKNRFPEDGKYDDIYLMPQILASATKVSYHGLSKYCFVRHDCNNSAWTQNHKLLDKVTLEEYLDVYKKRTGWLCEMFPDSAVKWKYFEWSFMISMLEKVIRLELEDCYEVRDRMWKELMEHKEEFVGSGYLLDYEKQWVEAYL